MTEETETVRIVVCDDVAEIRVLLRLALEEDADLKVVGEAGDGEAGIATVADTRPDVVLLDLSMPGTDGLEAIPRIREVSPNTGIVVFSGFAAARMEQAVIDRGADRYLEKGQPLEVVRETVREVALAKRA